MREQLQEQMYGFIREFENSGLSQREFCAKYGIKTHKFQYWKRKYYTSKQGGIGFAEIEVSSAPILAPQVIIIKLPNGAVIEIPV